MDKWKHSQSTSQILRIPAGSRNNIFVTDIDLFNFEVKSKINKNNMLPLKAC